VTERILALVPARGGSKGLPGKALRPLGGVPLVGHAIELARRCPEVALVVVSTDDAEIARTAEELGAHVPFMRPDALAEDETPMWPVVRHAVAALDAGGDRYDAILLLQPTSPGRLPGDVAAAVRLLGERPEVDGVVAVAEAEPHPVWASMVEEAGLLRPLIPEAWSYARRQDLPRVLNVNGALFLWRAGLVRDNVEDPSGTARLAGVEMPRSRSIDVDTLEDLETAEALLAAGLLHLPWLD
jgi:N-acylneuraminate cytidylyltransferase